MVLQEWVWSGSDPVGDEGGAPAGAEGCAPAGVEGGAPVGVEGGAPVGDKGGAPAGDKGENMPTYEARAAEAKHLGSGNARVRAPPQVLVTPIADPQDSGATVAYSGSGTNTHLPVRW